MARPSKSCNRNGEMQVLKVLARNLEEEKGKIINFKRINNLKAL
jgi:hypothetical protein